MTNFVVAVILGAVGAVCFGAAAVVQHRAVGAVVDGAADATLSLPRLRALVSDRSWLLGTALGVAGVGLHASALSLAPLSLVQPVGVLAVPVAVLLVFLPARRRPSAAVLTGVGLTLAGVGALVVLSPPSGAGAPQPGASLLTAVVATAALVAALVAVSARLRGALRPLGWVGAGAVSFGLVSLLVRTVTTQVGAGALAPLDPLVLAMVATVALAALAGAWLVQQGLASGSPVLALACLTLVDPVVAVTLGALLGDGAPGSWAWAVAGVSAAVAGIAVLARFHPAVAGHGASGTGEPVDLRTPRGAGAADRSTLRIVIGADTYPPDVNGAARFTHRLAVGLAAHGHDVHVVAPSVSGPAGTERVGRVTVHHLRSYRLPSDTDLRACLPWRCRPEAAALLERIDPDVVHVQSHFPVGRALVRAARRSGRALVATNHTVPGNLMHHVAVPSPLRPAFSAWYWADLARVFSRAQVVTAPTPRAVAMLTDAGVRGAVPVSCGIDTAHHRAPDVAGPASDAVPTVLFVGRLDREKHVDELVRALAALPADLPARLEVIGQGPRRAAWTALADELGVGDRVDFRGFVVDEELDAAYARAAVFVMPGTAELQSLVTLEAMAAGLPVVAADAMALPHLVHPGVNGWLYPPGRPEVLAERLADLLADPDRRRRMGTSGRGIVAEHDLEATLATYEGLYASAMAGPSSRPVRPALSRSLAATTR